MTISRNTWSSW